LNELEDSSSYKAESAAHPLPVVEDFFQKEKGRRYSVDGPFSLLFNTLSDRLVSNGSAFLLEVPNRNSPEKLY
jgi:hypothetical protein